MTTIKLKNGSGAPTAGDLVQGEPALDLTNKRLYTENASGTVIEVGTNPTSLTTGTFTSTGIDDNATSTAITIDSNENVGIGTTSPNIAGFSRCLTIDGADSGVELSSGGTVYATLAANAQGANLQGVGTSGIRMFTAASGSATERMRIDSSGNVGIGTSSPATPLQVRTGTNENLAVQTKSGAIGITAFNDAVSSNVNLHLQGTQLIFDGAGSAERMRIDSSGNLLVGTTQSSVYNSSSNSGHVLEANGTVQHSRSGFAPMLLNRISSDGNITEFFKDGSLVGSIGNQGADILINAAGTGRLGSGGVGYFKWDSNQFYPAVDNARDLGFSTFRWDDVYATNALIQTSDRNEKQDIAELSDAEQRVAKACKGLLRKFRWKDAVAEKGDEARTHFGIIAQDLQAAFAAEGLDAGDYAMFISSTWTDEETGEEKTRMGVRYSELLAFIIAAL